MSKMLADNGTMLKGELEGRYIKRPKRKAYLVKCSREEDPALASSALKA